MTGRIRAQSTSHCQQGDRLHQDLVTVLDEKALLPPPLVCSLYNHSSYSLNHFSLVLFFLDLEIIFKDYP